jgi:hypothetical protein
MKCREVDDNGGRRHLKKKKKKKKNRVNREVRGSEERKIKICQIPPNIQMEPNHTCPPIISSKSSTLTIHPSPPTRRSLDLL